MIKDKAIAKRIAGEAACFEIEVGDHYDLPSG